MSKIKATAMPDEDWKGRCDAQTIMDAGAIHSDPSRLKKAVPHLEKLHKEHLGKMIAAKSAMAKAKKDPVLKASKAYRSQSAAAPHSL